MAKLQYISTPVYDELRRGVHSNLDRYRVNGFDDLSGLDGWSIPLEIEVDLADFRLLRPDRGPEAEVFNSLIVWRCLSKLTPSLATEGRIWTRLTHIEGLAYARARWIGGREGERANKAVLTHFFGESLTRYRDDNAIGRLWWNAYIARLAMRDNQFEALKLLLKSADIRSNIVERRWLTSRPQIAGGILRAMMRVPATTSSEESFRSFMKVINRNGGGILFELLSEPDIDAYMDECMADAE